MADTYTLISSVTVGSGGASSIDFTSIPATYTDLKLVTSLRPASGTGATYAQITFNGTGSGYSMRRLYGSGSGTGSGSNSAQSKLQDAYLTNGTDYTASVFANGELYIPNYAGSNQKSVSLDSVQENNGTAAYAFLSAGLSNITSAITSIKLETDNASNFAQHSSAYLYGIKNS